MPNQSTGHQEEWRPVAGHEGLYEVSDLGRVRRVRGGAGARAGRIIKTWPTTGGYRVVSLFKDRGRRSYKVHRFVAMAFLGLPPLGCEVNHKDGNPGNNCADNLEWVTRSANLRHSYRELARPRTNGGNNKLTAEDAAAIRAAIESGVSRYDLADRFGVHPATISKVRLGQIWR